MSALRIITYDDPVLRKKARPIGRITARHRQLARYMAETMYENHGVGLAANQVGCAERIVVMDVEWAEKDENGRNRNERRPLFLINPEILEESDNDEVLNEGCLSLPEIRGDVWRPTHIRFRHQDLTGKTVEGEATGLLARCVQHEIDHLDGILFIDRMNKDDRRQLAGQLAALRKTRSAQTDSMAATTL